MDNFKNLEIILVNTQIPENLGFVARAMLNCGLKKLRLVSPEFDINNEKILPIAAGADEVIKKMRVFNSYSEAIRDFNFLIASTARNRSLKKPNLTPEKAAHEAIEKVNAKNKVGFVFGPEKSGLTNENLSIIDKTVTIKTNPSFSSINLSHAVMIICYELIKLNKLIKFSNNKGKLIKKEKLIFFYNHIEKLLNKSGFIKTDERKDMIILKIKNIFSKSSLEENEIDILFGIFTSLYKAKNNK